MKYQLAVFLFIDLPMIFCTQKFKFRNSSQTIFRSNSVENCLLQLFSTLNFLYCLTCKVEYSNYCNKELEFSYTDVSIRTSVRN